MASRILWILLIRRFLDNFRLFFLFYFIVIVKGKYLFLLHWILLLGFIVMLRLLQIMILRNNILLCYWYWRNTRCLFSMFLVITLLSFFGNNSFYNDAIIYVFKRIIIPFIYWIDRFVFFRLLWRSWIESIMGRELSIRKATFLINTFTYLGYDQLRGRNMISLFGKKFLQLYWEIYQVAKKNRAENKRFSGNLNAICVTKNELLRNLAQEIG